MKVFIDTEQWCNGEWLLLADKRKPLEPETKDSAHITEISAEETNIWSQVWISQWPLLGKNLKEQAAGNKIRMEMVCQEVLKLKSREIAPHLWSTAGRVLGLRHVGCCRNWLSDLVLKLHFIFIYIWLQFQNVENKKPKAMGFPPCATFFWFYLQ